MVGGDRFYGVEMFLRILPAVFALYAAPDAAWVKLSGAR